MDYVVINQPRVIPRQRIYQSVKRLMDIVLCILSLPITIPIMIISAIFIYLTSEGPVVFVQDRIGKGGRPFRVYKFRTMKLDLDIDQCQNFMKAYVRGEIGESEGGKKIFKPVDEDQIIRVGRFLRKTSIDELPQLINILKGEMSIVGPRPNVPWEVDEYKPWHYERLEVLPGLTGLAQVRGRSCIDFNSLVRNDIEYIEKQSLYLDFKIIFWTFSSILGGKGAK